MSARLSLIRTTLAGDAVMADRVTTCRRQGTIARALSDEAPRDVISAFLPSVNGSAACKNIKGGCGCAHAEQKLIVEMLKTVGTTGKRWTLLSTLAPCEQCANLVVLSGLFHTVAWLRPYAEGAGLKILEAAGIKLIAPQSPFSHMVQG